MTQKFPDLQIDLLVETSWEVCNKVGGIYTVLSTKAKYLNKVFKDRLVFIGPDVWTDDNESQSFVPDPAILGDFQKRSLPEGLKVRCGKWNIPGSPQVILVDFKPIFPTLNATYGKMWELFGVDSLHAYGDYDESNAFSIAVAIVIRELISHLGASGKKTIAHFNEWTTGMGLLKVKDEMPEVATVFTTHATTVGRSICGNNKPLYKYFHNYFGDQMARELNVEAKHSLEKAAALNADCFTTVSEVTARECEQLLGVRPDVVTPNGFEPAFVPPAARWAEQRKEGRRRILNIASLLRGRMLKNDTLIMATSGRNEYRNKGLDVFLDSAVKVGEWCARKRKDLLALVLVPAWVDQPSSDLLIDLEFGGWVKPEPDYLTHRLHNEDSDAIACNIRRLNNALQREGADNAVQFLYVPCYLDGSDGIVNIKYYDLLPAIDITVFGSYYEPWGYTPLESISFGVPTVTTDKAGFGLWAIDEKADSIEEAGVAVVAREDDGYQQSVDAIAAQVCGFAEIPASRRKDIRKNALKTANKADWKFFISKYFEAFETALGHKR